MEPKIFGSHDERTLAQMQRCMQVGSVAGGVLCADGHLGYAMPVGGVIAYEDHVSISGVGFNIACGNMERGRGEWGGRGRISVVAAYEIKECDWSSDMCSSDLSATRCRSAA